jgi:hypothetical protein
VAGGGFLSDLLFQAIETTSSLPKMGAIGMTAQILFFGMINRMSATAMACI